MREIPLTQGQVAIVDDGDYEMLSAYKWHATLNKRGIWYAERNGCTRPRKSTVRMHRQIMQPARGLQVDHIDGDGLNNQRSNLRIATNAQNSRNSKGKGGIYKGVGWHKAAGKYVAHIMVNYRSIHLGLFTDPIEAALAYDTAARQYYGEYARLNFPCS